MLVLKVLEVSEIRGIQSCIQLEGKWLIVVDDHRLGQLFELG